MSEYPSFVMIQGYLNVWLMLFPVGGNIKPRLDFKVHVYFWDKERPTPLWMYILGGLENCQGSVVSKDVKRIFANFFLEFFICI